MSAATLEWRAYRAGFDLERYGEFAAFFMADHACRRGTPIELYVVPGRELSANFGHAYSKVFYVNTRSDRVIVGIAARRLSFRVGCYIPIKTASTARSSDRGIVAVAGRSVYIYGNYSYSLDFLARNVRLPRRRAEIPSSFTRPERTVAPDQRFSGQGSLRRCHRVSNGQTRRRASAPLIAGIDGCFLHHECGAES